MSEASFQPDKVGEQRFATDAEIADLNAAIAAQVEAVIEPTNEPQALQRILNIPEIGGAYILAAYRCIEEDEYGQLAFTEAKLSYEGAPELVEGTPFTLQPILDWEAFVGAEAPLYFPDDPLSSLSSYHEVLNGSLPVTPPDASQASVEGNERMAKPTLEDVNRLRRGLRLLQGSKWHTSTTID